LFVSGQFSAFSHQFSAALICVVFFEDATKEENARQIGQKSKAGYCVHECMNGQLPNIG